jgi:hypothetical protein
LKIRPSPTEEEVAAIVVALETPPEEDKASLKRSRWRLAGLLGHPVEPGMELDGSLWSYSRWEE